MKRLTQKQIDKLPVVSFETLAQTSGEFRHYVVYVGKDYTLAMLHYYTGLSSTNHLDVLKEFVSSEVGNHPIRKVLLDNRKSKNSRGFGIGCPNSPRDYQEDFSNEN